VGGRDRGNGLELLGNNRHGTPGAGAPGGGSPVLA
jgi:hypothetical protein